MTHESTLTLVSSHDSGRFLAEASADAFASLANRAGFDVTAVEMDPAYCHYLDQVVGDARLMEDPVGSARRAVMQQEDRVETLREVAGDVAHHVEPGNPHTALFILTGGVTV